MTMCVDILSLYHRVPPPLRSFVATLRGFQLNSWRYGGETEGLMREAVERETWSPAQWSQWQEERLSRLLHLAATRVPFYRQWWSERRRRGDRTSWDVLEHWPVLGKDVVRAQPRAFVADDMSPSRMMHDHTSGTTGKPLDLWRSRRTLRRLYALSEVRERGWHGVSRRDRWAILGGQLVSAIHQPKPPFWVWNAASRQLYMSSYHLGPAMINFYLDALEKYQVHYLWGYTSSLYALAEYCIQTARQPRTMAVAITNAEPVYPYQREAIEKAFGCPVRETYGLSETVATATECPSGSLHLWPEVGILEVEQNGNHVPDGSTGEFVCTGLLNEDMPLIRYRTGDRGAIPARDALCPCGRTLPRIDHVEGRIDDVLYLADGRRIGRLDPVFKSNLPIVEAQVEQETINRFRVRYVPEPGFRSVDEGTISARLRERLGQVEIIMERVEAIPRTSNGKFRAVICNLSPAEKEVVQLRAGSVSDVNR